MNVENVDQANTCLTDLKPAPATAIKNTSAHENITWRFLSFDALTQRELYELLQLRSEIFVVEQACIFQDMDGADVDAMHLLGTQAQKIVAYARCFNTGVKYAEASIGRIVTRDTLRGSGAGHQLVQKAIACMTQCWGLQAIRIGAQQRLEKFYAQHGFVQVGQAYHEDGIPHIEMLRAHDVKGFVKK